jgi:ribosomal protein S3
LSDNPSTAQGVMVQEYGKVMVFGIARTVAALEGFLKLPTNMRKDL